MGFFDDIAKKTKRLGLGKKMRHAYRIGKKVASHSIKIGRRVTKDLEHLGKKSADTLHNVRRAIENTEGVGDMLKEYEGIPIVPLGGLTANQLLTGVEAGLRLGGRTAGGVNRVLNSRNSREALVNTRSFATNEGRDVARAIKSVVRGRNTKASSS